MGDHGEEGGTVLLLNPGTETVDKRGQKRSQTRTRYARRTELVAPQPRLATTGRLPRHLVGGGGGGGGGVVIGR